MTKVIGLLDNAGKTAKESLLNYLDFFYKNFDYEDWQQDKKVSIAWANVMQELMKIDFQLQLYGWIMNNSTQIPMPQGEIKLMDYESFHANNLIVKKYAEIPEGKADMVIKFFLKNSRISP